MNRLIYKVYQKAKFYYYNIFVVTGIVAFFAHYFKKEFPEFFKFSWETQTITSTIMFLYLSLSVPFAFWAFNKKVKTLNLITDELKRYKIYLNWIRLRISLIAINLVINIGLYFIINSSSYFFAAAIGFTALIFCKPNIKNMDNELTLTNEIEE